VVVERLPNGRWKLVRERDESGETFVCDDLLECWETVDAAYRPDGTPREWRPTVDADLVEPDRRARAEGGARMSSAGHEWTKHERDGWSVCSRCGMVRNYDRELTTCSGALPKIRQRSEIEDCGQDGVCRLSPGCNRHWEERNRELVRERDAALARVRKLEVASRALLAALPSPWTALEAARDLAGVLGLTEDDLARPPAVGAPRLRRGDVVRVKGSALVELRDRLGDVLDVNGGEVLVNVATAQGPQRYWLFVEQVEPTQTARLPAGCACGGEGWCDACEAYVRRSQ
jgi:hypothetical protein